MADLTNPITQAITVTVDDFDPLISYSNYADWTTPDPSQNPTWYNATPDVTNSPWHQGESFLARAYIETAHKADTQRRTTKHRL
jgi:hypothetical protein